ALLEVGEHVVIAPALEAELAPLVVVARVAAGVEHAVDHRRSAEALAARLAQAAVIGKGLGLALVAPVEALIDHDHREGDRHGQQRMALASPGFDEGDADVRVFAEARGDDGARRARADDDVVGGFDGGLHSDLLPLEGEGRVGVYHAGADALRAPPPPDPLPAGEGELCLRMQRHLLENRPERIFTILPFAVLYMLMLSTILTSPFIVGQSSKSGQSLMVVNLVRLCSAAPLGATIRSRTSSSSAMCSNTCV